MNRLDDLILRLQEAAHELGESAPVYFLLNDRLYTVVVDVVPKGNLGPGSVLLLKGRSLT